MSYVFIKCHSLPSRSRDNSVAIPTNCGLGGPGIEYRWGARFSAPVQTCSESHPASCTIGTGSFPGVKRPGRGVEHPPPSSAEVKERVELYLYSHLWAFVVCSRVNFTYSLPTCFDRIAVIIRVIHKITRSPNKLLIYASKPLRVRNHVSHFLHSH